MEDEKIKVEDELKNQITINETMQSKIDTVKSENTELLKRIEYNKQPLKDAKNEYHTKMGEYNVGIHRLEQELKTHFKVDYLRTLFYVCRLLKNHPRRTYTLGEIEDKLQWSKKLDEQDKNFLFYSVKEALALTNYMVIPVRHTRVKGVSYFKYDKFYLTRPLAYRVSDTVANILNY